MFVHRLRRSSNLRITLDEHRYQWDYKRTQGFHPTLVQFWASVIDSALALSQYWECGNHGEKHIPRHINIATLVQH